MRSLDLPLANYGVYRRNHLVIGDDCIIKPPLRDNDWTLSTRRSKMSLGKRHRVNQESDISQQ